MNEPDNPTVVESPGATLAAARQAQNLSVADAARQLRLSVSQIEALEAGAFEKLPGTIFVRGFTRNYARLLKLDADALLRSVDLTLPSAPVTGEMPPSQEIPFPTAKSNRGPWYAFALVSLLGGLAAFEFFWNEPVSTVSKTDTLPAAPVQKIDPPAPAPYAEPAKPTDVPVASPAASAPRAAMGANVADKTVAGVPSAVQAAAAEGSRQPQPGERPLRLVFKQESWVEIRDRSGKIVFSQLNPAGSEKRIYGAPPMSVVIGNAHGAQLTYNDRPVDLALHTKVDVARFTLE
ncbi:MAG: helix-turn-helix domain-containing protein [Burkholderiales bacterium]|nr:helix-turn-helix domain-containing protein [Burkholderiales bacterium]